MRKILLLATLVVSVGALQSCMEEKKNESPVMPEEANAKDSALVEHARSIFHSLPSPLELSSLIKISGGDFRPDLLHDPNKTSQYATLEKQALNLGVYGADLSYSTVFEQTQSALKFMAAAKRVGQKMGVTEAFRVELIERANNNLDNRDSMLTVLTEIYWLTNSQLREDDRSQMATLVMIGGWIEGMYIGCNIPSPDKPHPDIVLRLMEQRYTAEQVQAVLAPELDHPMFTNISPKLQPLFDFFAGLEVQESGEVKVSSTNEKGVATIGGKKTIVYTAEHLQELRTLTTNLRNDIIQ